jgi:hypothetical protein
MGTDPTAPEPALHLTGLGEAKDARFFVEVEGALEERSGVRWRALLRGVLLQHARGLIVDLRGCPAVNDQSLMALQATGATMEACGGPGVVLVTWPGSALAEELHGLADGELRSYASAKAALAALDDHDMDGAAAGMGVGRPTES